MSWLQVALSNPEDAESLVARGILKRSTAATNANSNSRFALSLLMNMFPCSFVMDVFVQNILMYLRKIFLIITDIVFH